MAGMLDYTAGNTVLHRLNPLTKVALALGICVAAFLSDNFGFLLALLVLDVALGFVGGIRKKTLKLLAGLAGICAFLFVLQVLFIRSGTPVFLFATDEGLRTAGLVVLRLIDATMPLALMLALTPLNDLAGALVKRARLPYKYAFTVTTALKFVPVFTDEMGAIMEAQTARGVEFDTRNPVRKLRLMLPLCAPLLITSVGKTEQAAMAAEVRGFYLRDRTSGVRDYPFRALDAGAFALVAALIVLAVVL
ncbi:energy-coupling factor transporter transmembrane component T family protein [Gordonibacter massiliensis (ex Traore et al. 2017)]|uniref:energy-coupling factor transporter transmembrane component T family protein n=1 Tax=Gordonibacter massiliensis (ex Traore et al. 2017) TaxID=1841863 RepID=UPI001C8BD168|nr:energy-coupling factor transporter transmembrane component T [Gordonibacter massiliensis (ex Traore et al. 2017)]MBX9034154.1 energy-coupling factor transporter transmembrane protein EcfT [Gordonibacter massiliensis (ex Traore et al. 2017)]